MNSPARKMVTNWHESLLDKFWLLSFANFKCKITSQWNHIFKAELWWLPYSEHIMTFSGRQMSMTWVMLNTAKQRENVHITTWEPKESICCVWVCKYWDAEGRALKWQWKFFYPPVSSRGAFNCHLASWPREQKPAETDVTIKRQQ